MSFYSADLFVELPKGREEFQKIILDYYSDFGRFFPWRETDDPYAIWVSEIMLQQTQTERVLPKYREWMKVFPTIQSVAETPLSTLLSYWSGLGYNRRCKFLQDAAKQIMGNGGIFPSRTDDMKKLPGIGAYTAGAISAFAFNRPEVFIETNIRAVFIFFFFSEQGKVTDKELLPLIEQTLDRNDPRRWYYALMDYGAQLKKKTVNPGRLSAHYTKQSKFEGSLRQARGAIVRQLTRLENNALDLSFIEKEEHIDYQRLKKAAESLVAENILCKEDDKYFIVR